MSASSRSEMQTDFIAEDQNSDPQFTAIVIQANVTTSREFRPIMSRPHATDEGFQHADLLSNVIDSA
jgi:hypothetical protein